MPSSAVFDLDWYKLEDSTGVVSPALLIYPTRIEENIQTMISMAKGPANLRPHIKTHKMGEIVKMQQRHGIQKFKCATIAEAELLGLCEAEDVLLAMQPVAINIERFFALIEAFPKTQFSTIADNLLSIQKISDTARLKNQKAHLFLDINCGMNRTGCNPDTDGFALYQAMDQLLHIHARGLHSYDGHIHDTDIQDRKVACDNAYQSVLKLKDKLTEVGIEIPQIVAGGSPSFPIHCQRKGVETSPGTTLLWDAQYAEHFPDMPFLPAAVLLIRVISKPSNHLLCLDLGHKFIAPEMPLPRVRLMGLEDSTQISQSEEHLVVQTDRAHEFNVGDSCYAIPEHICPTVAKYKEAFTISEGKVTGTWKVAARDQRITI